MFDRYNLVDITDGETGERYSELRIKSHGQWVMDFEGDWSGHVLDVQKYAKLGAFKK